MGDTVDKSGSCAIILITIDEMAFVANVGDSRAILSANIGSKIYSLSKDHKPNELSEQKRIIENGGKIYQTKIPHKIPLLSNCGLISSSPTNLLTQSYSMGPIRVLPGRLSVSRTLGDIEAKLKKYGGAPNIIIAEPEIKSFKLQADYDFIFLGCDGIFDKLSNKEVIDLIW